MACRNNNKTSKVQGTLGKADICAAALFYPLITLLVMCFLLNLGRDMGLSINPIPDNEFYESSATVVPLNSSLDSNRYDNNVSNSNQLSRVKAISNQLNVYDLDWIEEANDFTLTDKQFQIARNSVIALNTGLNPCDQTSIFFKIKGRQIVQANSFKDLAVLSYFCEHPDAIVGGGL